MIEKKKPNSKINRLRIINKYEANYKLILKLYWFKITNRIIEWYSWKEPDGKLEK